MCYLTNNIMAAAKYIGAGLAAIGIQTKSPFNLGDHNHSIQRTRNPAGHLDEGEMLETSDESATRDNTRQDNRLHEVGEVPSRM